MIDVDYERTDTFGKGISFNWPFYHLNSDLLAPITSKTTLLFSVISVTFPKQLVYIPLFAINLNIFSSCVIISPP